MSQQSINSNSDLSALLLFQDNFISSLHTHLYHKTQPFQEVFLTFQIHHVSEINDKFNNMLSSLSSQLIDRKLTYELNLRDSFQRLLQADFLPLLRINRYELTKLSLFGFDIYVEPLEAVLQILSRLEVSKKRLLQSNIVLQSVTGAESALQKGWQVYMAWLQQWKITFNLYILQEYLRVGGKSFLKKDRQILFTGISNLYNQLVTNLSRRKNLKLLKELAQLNNSLYHFHQSFNYFQFYAFLLPLDNTLEPIFASMKEIAQKCLRTNILTPLLFGILRHRESFLKFIDEADSAIWLPYLNAIISGIAINLKFRILEYEQIIDIFERAVNRAGLLGTIDTSYIFGTLQDGWRDAKQFFISAVKVGFNSGEVQIWKSIEFQQIGPKIISSVIDGMLLNVEKNKQLDELLGQDQSEQKLEEQLLKMSERKVNSQMVRNSICHLQKNIESQQKLLNLLRILNLMRESDEYCLKLAITSILSLKMAVKPIIQLIINACVDKINRFLINFKGTNFSLIKDNVMALHGKFKPVTRYGQIISLYIRNYDTKKCVSALLDILPIHDPTCLKELAIQISSCYLSQSSKKLIKIRTFEQELTVNSYLVNPSYETHSVLTVLVTQINKDNTANKAIIQQLTNALIATNPSVVYSLFNFPVTHENNICSFLHYLIQNKKYHPLLKSILLSSRGQVKSRQSTDLFQALIYPNLTENVCKKINETEDVAQMHPFLNLLLWTIENLQRNEILGREILGVYLFALQNAESQHLIEAIVDDIALLASLSFGVKLQFWLASLFILRIQNKFELQRVNRKKTLKSNKSSVYFIDEIEENASKDLVHKNVQQSKRKEIQIQLKKYSKGDCQSHQEEIADFWSVFERLSQLNEEQLLSILSNQKNTLQQQTKHLLIPSLNSEILKAILKSQQSHQKNRSLQIIVLNTDNYLATIQHFLEQKNFAALKTSRMIIRLTSNINDFLRVQAEHKQNFMGQMSQDLSLKERKRIAQCFYLEWSSLQYYVQYMEGIEYLTIYNPTNWRMLMEYLNKQFSGFKLPSLLLQYKEYLSITSQPNEHYESSIRSQGLLFRKYTQLFIAKLQSIFESSLCQEEIELKCAHQLSSLNLVVASVQLREVVTKLGQLHKEMNQRGIAFEQYWISDIAELTSVLNNRIKGRVLLPDFTHGFMLTNGQILHKYKVEIGLILQEYCEIIGSQANTQRYIPTQLKKVIFSELSRDAMTIIDPTSIQISIQTYQKQILTTLKNNKCIVQQADNWHLDFQHITESSENLQMFYRLGCFSALQQGQSQRCKMPQFLREIVSRQKLRWQVLKPIRGDQFHFIKSLLVQPEIASRDLFFIHQEQELIADGKSIKVNDYNKLAYCQAIALNAIGKPVLRCAQYFLEGFTNQHTQV